MSGHRSHYHSSVWKYDTSICPYLQFPQKHPPCQYDHVLTGIEVRTEIPVHFFIAFILGFVNMLILTLSYCPAARWKAELFGYMIDSSKGNEACLNQALRAVDKGNTT